MKKTSTQSSPEQYDLLILGSGAAGKLLSWTMAKKGMKVAAIERKYIGGSCPNIACLPAKNIIHSAKVASYFRRSEEFGISKDNWKVDMAAVRERKRTMVNGFINGHIENYEKSGAELIMGEGRFVGPKTIEVILNDGGVRFLQGAQVVINTGSRAFVDGLPGLQESDPLTHIEALELDEIPVHLVVLGGGFVGLELAHAMRRFGSRVTIIERAERLVPREDDDIAKGLTAVTNEAGISLVLNAQVTRVAGKSGEGMKLFVTRNGKEEVVEGSHLLVAAGRKPNTEGIGLELTGVGTTGNGYIKVNDRLETTMPGVWAAGECAGSAPFTHISENDFHIVMENIQGGNRVTTGRQVPFCLFTDPEFARIGLNEKEAKEQGIAYKLATLPYGAIFRAQTIGETQGFLKALIHPDNNQIIGFSAFGADAGEVMATVQIAMLAKLPYTALRDAIFAHPTMSEGLIQLFLNVQ
jgi:pyruvate/2-oxoglutarate dehydrogenase complex dihydrolipoamide dehydrogenase (E3) component